MKRLFIVATVLAAVSPVFAETPDPKPTPTPPPAVEPAAPDFSEGRVSFGAWQRDVDSNSSKFYEYRDIPNGAQLPQFRFEGKKGDLRWDLDGRDVGQKDQRYFFDLATPALHLFGDYTGIPHEFGRGGKSLLAPVHENEWRLSDTVQQSYQGAIVAVPPTAALGGQIDYNCEPRVGFTPLPTCFSLSSLVAPGLVAAPSNVDLELHRGRTRLGLDLTPGEGPLELGVSYMHERRTGYRAANGTSFGFGNVVETPEPVRYITQDFAVQASLNGGWGVARAAVRYNDFKDNYADFRWDNPFRATDSWDANAYQAPSTASRNGSVEAIMALPPDNKAISGTLGTTLKLGDRTRLSADVSLGQWKQNEDPLVPWTANTSVPITLGGVSTGQLAYNAPLPAAKLDGKIDTLSLNGFFTTRVGPLGLNARFRHYENDNKTPRYTMSGYVRYDAVWEEIPRITVPNGFTSGYFDAYATYDAGPFGLEAGWKHSRVERKFRETEETKEDVFRAAVDWRGGIFALHAIGEVGNRDFDSYHAVEAEEHSFLESGLPANQTVLRRYDQAKRDLVRVGGQLELAPLEGKLGMFASYYHTKFEYDQANVHCEDVELFSGQAAFCPGGEQKPLGLVDDRYDTLSVDLNFNPSDRFGVYAFYSYEDGDILQTGRQSAATLNFNPLDVWTSNITTKGHTLGGGADFTLVKDRWYAGLWARYQDIDGNNDVYLQPGFSTSIYGTNPALVGCTTPGAVTPCSIAAFDDTTLGYVYGSLRHQFAKGWSALVGVGYEDYEIGDAQTGNTLNYMPASFFLQANNRSYQAWVGYLTLSYVFD